MDPLKRNSGKLAQSMAKHFDSIHNTIIGIVVILVFASLPLAALIVGSMRINECPIEYMVPIWLLVIGVTGVFGFSCLIIALICNVWCCYDKDSDNFGIIGCVGLVGAAGCFFYFIWTIAGGVWIFRAKPSVQSNDTISSNYCHESVYNFSFGLVITLTCIYGILVCCCLCGCCYSCCSKEDVEVSTSASA